MNARGDDRLPQKRPFSETSLLRRVPTLANTTTQLAADR